MLRFKYVLHQGIGPHEAIVENSTLNRFQMRLGLYCQIESNQKWLYGEVETSDTDEQNAIVAACSDWSLTVLNDTEAMAFADAHGAAPGDVLQFKITQNAASIVNNRVEKTTTTHP